MQHGQFNFQVREKGEGRDGGGGEGRPGLPLGRPPRGAERRLGGGRTDQQRLGGAPLALLGEGSGGRKEGRLLGQLIIQSMEFELRRSYRISRITAKVRVK